MEARQPLFDEHGNLTLEGAHQYANGGLSEAERAQVDQFLAESGLDADVLDDFDGAAAEEVAASILSVNQQVAARAGSATGGRAGLIVGAVAIVIIGVASWLGFPSGNEAPEKQTANNHVPEAATPESESPMVFDSVSIGAPTEVADDPTITDGGQPDQAASGEGSEERPTKPANSSEGNDPRPNELGTATEPTVNNEDEPGQSDAASTTTASPESEIVMLRFAISSEPVYKNEKQRIKNTDTELEVGKREELAIMRYLKANAFNPEGLQCGGQALFFLEVDDKGDVVRVRTQQGHSANLDLMMVELLRAVELTGTDEKLDRVKYRVLVNF